MINASGPNKAFALTQILQAVITFLLLVMACTTVFAEQAKKVKIGYVSWWPPAQAEHVDYVREGLGDLGYVEGKDFEIESYFTDGNRQRTQEVIGTLVTKGVDILVASGTPAVHIAKDATQTIPIVMAPVADPVATGLVQSLAHPGGNLTGLSALAPDLMGKRLEMLREIMPSVRTVSFLGSSKDPNTATFVRETQAGTDKIGLNLVVKLVEGPDAIGTPVFEAMKGEGVEAAVVQPIFTGHQDKIVALAMKSRLPVISQYAVFAKAGALLTYGVDDVSLMRRAAYYVDRILKGAKPAELPIEQPTKFQLVVNFKTAKALGLTVPSSLLVAADEVIE
jgi:putative ABC transport system substrate-binding protein